MKTTEKTIAVIVTLAPVFLALYWIRHLLAYNEVKLPGNSSDIYAFEAAFGVSLHLVVGLVSFVGAISKWKTNIRFAMFLVSSLTYCALIIFHADKLWPASGFMAMAVGFNFIILFPLLLVIVAISIAIARTSDRRRDHREM